MTESQFLQQSTTSDGEPCVLVVGPPSSLHDAHAIIDFARTIGAVVETEPWCSEEEAMDLIPEEDDESDGEDCYRINFVHLNEAMHSSAGCGLYTGDAIRRSVRIALGLQAKQPAA